MRTTIEPVADPAHWDEWQQVTAPTLLVEGQNGTMAAAEVHRMMSVRPDVEHVVVPDAGHDVHLDQPEAWVHALLTFLDGQHHCL